MKRESDTGGGESRTTSHAQPSLQTPSAQRRVDVGRGCSTASASRMSLRAGLPAQ